MECVNNPVSVALQAHYELTAFVEVAFQGLGWAVNAQRVHDVLVRSSSFPTDPMAVQYHLDRAKIAENFGQRQSEGGFPYLWYLAVVRLWTILEVLVDDLVLEHLSESARLPESSVVRSLKGSLLDFLDTPPESRPELLLTLIKEKLRSGLSFGAARFEMLLDAVGLGGPIEDEIRRVLGELVQVRNLVVHKNGVVDQRFATTCPWVAAASGEQFPISSGQFVMYEIAVDWYILEIYSRARQFKGEPADVSAIDLQQDLLDKVRAILQKRGKYVAPPSRLDS